jgi:hypothetical protein
VSKKLERDFLNAARKMKQKNRKIAAQRVGVFLLILAAAAGLVYLFSRKNSLIKLGDIGLDSNILLLSIAGLVIVVGALIYFLSVQNPKQPARSRSNSNILKYFFGCSLLLGALLYQSNPTFINSSTQGFFDRLRYKPAPPLLDSPWSWKQQEKIHPVVVNLPADREKSIQSVAEYIAQREPDPHLRIKALHDYVISRITYDLPVLKTGKRPSQDAQTVFSTRKAVCEGYANLFMALGKSIGIEVVFVGGKVRQDLAPLELIPKTLRLLKGNYDWTLHAWNAVKVAGDWQLVDTTWDDSDSTDPNAAYSAAYLMPPPEVMIASHLPEQSDWQLLRLPKSPSTFEEQPILTPEFFMEKLVMLSPLEYSSKVANTGLIEVKSPLNSPKKVAAIFAKRQEAEVSLWNPPTENPFAQENLVGIKKCQTQNQAGAITQISCPFPSAGDYQVLLFSLQQPTEQAKGKVTPIGQLRFHAGS